MARWIAMIVFAGLMASACSMAADGDAEAKPEPSLPPIKAVEGVTVKAAAFEQGGATRPIAFADAGRIGDYFDDVSAERVRAAVDFEQQRVLIFAWRGSGHDALTHTVAESYPEQVKFNYKRGLTRDLREHVKVYVLRSNVSWSVLEAGAGER